VTIIGWFASGCLAAALALSPLGARPADLLGVVGDTSSGDR
jgi:hypothetical protein